MDNRDYDNLIRKANQRLARAQAHGFSNTREVRQLLLAQISGNNDIVINKKDQLQFKRSKNIGEDTYKMITKIATRNEYNISGLKTTYKDVIKVSERIGERVSMPRNEIQGRVFALVDELKNRFDYHDAVEIIDKIDDISDAKKRQAMLEKIEKELSSPEAFKRGADTNKKSVDKLIKRKKIKHYKLTDEQAKRRLFN